MLFVQTRAKNRLVVIACLAGNDYAANIKGKSFGTALKVAAEINDAEKADLLLGKVCAGQVLSEHFIV
jgi:hypothetical protein